MRQWTLAIAGVALIAAAAGIYLRGRPTPAAAPARQRSAVASPLLYVQHEGAALRLHWNAEAAEVRSAKSGALVVTDGAHESRMELRPEELRSGVGSWWPQSRDVTFRLELDGAPAGTMQASTQAEGKPSAFQPPAAGRKKGTTVKKLQPVAAQAAAGTPRRGSKIGRAFGKIPLLRRLKRHRD